jgi:hypothetical protein
MRRGGEGGWAVDKPSRWTRAIYLYVYNVAQGIRGICLGKTRLPEISKALPSYLSLLGQISGPSWGVGAGILWVWKSGSRTQGKLFSSIRT